MFKITVSHNNKTITLIIADDAFAYIQPPFSNEKKFDLLEQLALKSLHANQKDEILFIKSIYYTSSNKDLINVHYAPSGATKPKMYRVALQKNAPPRTEYDPTVEITPIEWNQHYEGRFAQIADKVLKQICEQDHPPIDREDSAANVMPPDGKYIAEMVEKIWLRADEAPDEKSKQSAQFFLSDTETVLKDAAAEQLNAIMEEISQFNSSPVKAAIHSAEEYTNNIAFTLKDNLKKELAEISVAIVAQTKMIHKTAGSIQDAANKAAVTDIQGTVNEYVAAEYEFNDFVKNLAAALHNAAKDYYCAIWTHNRGTEHPIKELHKKRDAFNLLFANIARINENFSFTTIDSAIDKIDEKALSVLLNSAYKKISFEEHDAFTFLEKRLAALNKQEMNPAGLYFNPVLRQKLNHKVIFNRNTKQILERLPLAEKALDNIKSKQLATLRVRSDEARASIANTAGVARDKLTAQLSTAHKNIRIFKELLAQKAVTSQTISDYSAEVATLKSRIANLATPNRRIVRLNLPIEQVNAIRELFPNRDTAKKRADVLTEIEMALEDETTALSDAFKSAKETANLEQLNSTEFDAVVGALPQIKRNIQILASQLAQDEHHLEPALNILTSLEQLRTAQDQLTQFQIRLNDNYSSNEFSDDTFALISAAAIQTHHAVDTALKAVPLNLLPAQVQPVIVDAELNFNQSKVNTAAILQCHMLLNSILDFEYWSRQTKLFQKKVWIENGAQSYSIPLPISDLIAIAKHPQHRNWATDPAVAKTLLNEVRGYHAENINDIKNKSVTTLFTAIDALDNNPSAVNDARNLANDSHPGMFNDQKNLTRLDTVTRRKPFHQRHPILAAALLGVGVALFVGLLIGLAVATAGLAVPAIFTGIGAAVGLVGGTAAAVGIAVGGLALFGAAAGAISEIAGQVGDRRKARKAAAAAPRAEVVVVDAATHQPTATIKLPPAKRVVVSTDNSNPFAVTTNTKDNNPFGSRLPEVNVAADRRSNLFAQRPIISSASQEQNSRLAEAFKEAFIREFLKLRSPGLHTEHIVQGAMDTTKPHFFERLLADEMNDKRTSDNYAAFRNTAIATLLQSDQFADFDPKLLQNSNQKFYRLVDNQHQLMKSNVTLTH